MYLKAEYCNVLSWATIKCSLKYSLNADQYQKILTKKGVAVCVLHHRRQEDLKMSLLNTFKN